MPKPWEVEDNVSATIRSRSLRAPLDPDSAASKARRIHGSEEGRCLIRFTSDIGSESTQGFGKARVTPVDVMCPADRRLAIGNEAGDDQRSPGPDVAGLDRGAGEPFDAVQHDVMAIHPRLRPETGELLNGAKARLEDVLGHHGAAAGDGVVDEGEGLQVGGEPWVGQGGNVERRLSP